jgi:hypothetical protein
VSIPPAGTSGASPATAAIPATPTTIPAKTTYAPLPFSLVMISLGIACAFADWRRR